VTSHDSGRRKHDAAPPRPTLAALLSTIVPGAGQWYGGRRRAALALGIGAGASAIAVVWLASLGPDRLLEVFVQTRWLWVLFAANLVLAAARIYAVGDAYRGERERGGGIRSHWIRWGALAALVAVTAAPHVIVADYSLEAIDLLETVFVDEDPAPVEERIAEALAEGVDPADLGPVLEPSTTTVPVAATTQTTGVTTTTAALPGPGASAPAPTTTTTLLPEGFPNFGGFESLLDPGVLEELGRLPSDANPFGLPPGDGAAAGADRLTVLLAGGDAGPDRWSLRTDVMIVATVDLTTAKAALIGISRDLVQVPLPEEFDDAFVDREQAFVRLAAEQAAATTTTAAADAASTTTTAPPPFESCRCWVDRINGLYTFTNSWFYTFPTAPDPGMEALRRTLSLLIGIPIDYYVMVDMAGFVDLVDALGGVDLTINDPMDVAFSPAREGEDPVAIDVEPGRHHLDGREALAYVRNRSDSNDGNRMRRQRCMLRALAAEATPGTLVARFPQIAEAIKESTTTDIPLSFVPQLIRIATGLDADDITTLAIGAPAHNDGYDFRNLPIVDTAKVQERVGRALAGLAAGQSFADSPECP
jgi:LCP family protein required for cell wall assembly